MKLSKMWVHLLSVFAITAFAVACGGGEDEQQMCTASEGDGATIIDCPDGTSVEIPHGEDGRDGDDGLSCSVSDNGDGTKTLSCEDGTEVVLTDGDHGTSCSVSDNGDGTHTLSCDDGTETTIYDGQGGEGGSCSVEDNGDGTHTISCDDGSETTIYDGGSCSVVDNTDGTYTMTCDDGSEVTFADGDAGDDGGSCSVVDNADGTYTMTCDDGTEVTFADGDEGSGSNDSCTVEDNGNGTATVSCPDGTSGTFDFYTPVPAALQITDFSISTDEMDITFSVTVTNIGTEDGETFCVDLHLDEDTNPGSFTPGDYFDCFTDLAGGDTMTFTGTVTIPEVGVYDGWATLDYDSTYESVDESYATAGPETYLIGADLAITDFDVSVSGSDVTFTATVFNIGSMEADYFCVDVHFDETSDPGPGAVGDEYDCYNDLARGDSVTNTIVASLSPGTYDAWVTLDLTDPDDDPDLSNNVMGPEQYTVDP